MNRDDREVSLAKVAITLGILLICIASFLPHFESDKIQFPFEFLLWAALAPTDGWERYLAFTAWPPFLLGFAAIVLYGLTSLAEVVLDEQWLPLARRVTGALMVSGIYFFTWFYAYNDLAGIEQFAHLTWWRAAVWAIVPLGLVSIVAVSTTSPRRIVPLAVAASVLPCLISLLFTWALGSRMNVQLGFWVSAAGCLLLAYGTFRQAISPHSATP